MSRGTLSGDGVTGNDFNPSGLSGLIELTYDYIDAASGCEYSTSTSIMVLDVPVSSFDLSSEELCVDDEQLVVSFSGSASGSATYIWDFGGGVAVPVGNVGGPHTVSFDSGGSATINLVIDDNGCFSEPFSLEVDLFESVDEPVLICEEVTNDAITFSWDAIENANGYEITIGTEIDTVFITSYEVTDLGTSESVSISVVALGNDICGNSDSVDISCTTTDCPEVLLTIDNVATQYCESDESVVLVATPIGGIFYIDGVEVTVFNPSDYAVGVHTLEYEYEEDDCLYDSELNFSILGDPIADFIIEGNVCVGDPISVVFSGAVSDGEIPVWDFGAATIISSNPIGESTIVFNSAGDYSISVVIDNNGCMDMMSQNIFVSDVSVQTIEDRTVSVGTTVELISTANSLANLGLNYEWTSDGALPNSTTILSPSITPYEDVQLQISVMDEAGCQAIDMVNLIVVFENTIAIPNAFSPNGDGINDLFRMDGENVLEAELYVYDRWGKQLFSSNELDAAWDGTYKGEIVELGVYVYYGVVKFEDGENQIYKGNVTIVR